MKPTSPEADPHCDDPKVTRRARIALAVAAEPTTAHLADHIDTYGASAVLAQVFHPALRSPAWDTITSIDAIAARLREVDVDAVIEHTNTMAARIVTPDDDEWPRRINDIHPRRPLALWVRGQADLAAASARSIAIVGSRAPSQYGTHIAYEWAAHFARAGTTVITGGDYGIDESVHRGAFRGKGRAIVVTPTGLDDTFPSGHRSLFASIAEQGAIVTDAAPGQTPAKARFDARRNLLAALAAVSCVVEAPEDSPATKTAVDAHRMNRPVFAVPGPITAATSRGPHELIRSRVATAAFDPDDIDAALDRSSPHALAVQ